MKVWLADKLRGWADWLDPEFDEYPPLTNDQLRAMLDRVAGLPPVMMGPSATPCASAQRIKENR